MSNIIEAARICERKRRVDHGGKIVFDHLVKTASAKTGLHTEFHACNLREAPILGLLNVERQMAKMRVVLSLVAPKPRHTAKKTSETIDASALRIAVGGGGLLTRASICCLNSVATVVIVAQFRKSPRIFPMKTSKPASASIKPKLCSGKLMTQLVEQSSRPCCKTTLDFMKHLASTHLEENDGSIGAWAYKQNG